MTLEDLVRPNIWRLAPYSSARDEYTGHEAHVFLDANENPYNNPYNRYPDPLQRDLKARVAQMKQVPEQCIFLGNGSDEAIDLVYRVFCRPGIDNVVAIEPTYGMYRVAADTNDVEYRPVQLNAAFQMSAADLLAATDQRTKVIWLCSPNNPTGNLLDRREVEQVLDRFPGIVVVDEAYSDFSRQRTFRQDLGRWPRLIVLNTMSKAWAAAAIRLGMAFAHPDIIALMNKVKYPYNVNLLTQRMAMEMLDRRDDVERWVGGLLRERSQVMAAFADLPIVERVYPSDANFFLTRVRDAQAVYDYLVARGIIVRNRTRVTLCQDCLRVTIGTVQENQELIGALRQYQGS